MTKKEFYTSAAWRNFSEYIRLKDSVYGFVRCVTCGKVKMLGREIHAGHFIKVFNGNSSNFSVAFDERNVYPQCVKCNRYLNGNELKMREHIIKTHGKDGLNDLILKSKFPVKLDKIVLKEISKMYLKIVKELNKSK